MRAIQKTAGEKSNNQTNQTSQQQKQAFHALNLYYAFETDDLLHDKVNRAPMPQNDVAQESSMIVTSEKTAWEQKYTELDTVLRTGTGVSRSLPALNPGCLSAAKPPGV
jgi:hypothetical protein